LVSLQDGVIKIRSRNQNDITNQFPELLIPEKAFQANCGLFDAEIVCLDGTGKPQFKKVIHRLMGSGETNIAKNSKSSPAFCYVFDCLYLDGRSLMNEPLTKRREWLKDAIKSDSPYRLSQIEEDGEALFDAAREHGLEGIMAKEKAGKYQPGKRSSAWQKIKVRNTAECVVIGYNEGQGNRASTFGGLHIAEMKDGKLTYRGKVGSGFNDDDLKTIGPMIKSLKHIKKPVEDKVLDEKVSKWVEPKYFVEVTYASLTPDKNFREPVFVQMRPDLS
jgi:bifunctional non-homologous end joining protein LigD